VDVQVSVAVLLARSLRRYISLYDRSRTVRDVILRVHEETQLIYVHQLMEEDNVFRTD